MTPLERAALALEAEEQLPELTTSHQTFGYQPPGEPTIGHWSPGYMPGHRVGFTTGHENTFYVAPKPKSIRLARAVLQAIREPSEGMMAAYGAALADHPPFIGASEPYPLGRYMHQAMIDAALEEG